MLPSIDNGKEPAQRRHCNQLLFRRHYSTYTGPNQQTASRVAEKENPAEPCTPQKKTLHSKAVSAALLCASNIRDGRAAAGGLHPDRAIKIPFFHCRFRYGSVSRTKQEAQYQYMRDGGLYTARRRLLKITRRCRPRRSRRC